jgi:hypothetical protein
VARLVKGKGRKNMGIVPFYQPGGARSMGSRYNKNNRYDK